MTALLRTDLSRTADFRVMPDPNPVDSLIDQARESMKKRQYPRAISLYGDAIAENGDCIQAHEGLATAAFMIQDYDLAVDHFKRVSMLDPRRAEPLINLGAVHNRQGDYQSAVKQLRNALAKDRKSAEAYYNLGIAYRGLKQSSMAVSAYREAIRLNPDMAEAYQNLANAYAEQGNSQQAILNYRRALELRPDFERAKRGLEQALTAANAEKDSISPFGRLVDTDTAKTDVDQSPIRKLNAQERFEDRTKVHQLSKDIETSAAILLNQLRDRLEERLLKLTHAFSQSDDRYNFNDEYQAFQAAYSDFRRAEGLLRQHTDELRAHEKFIRS